MSTAFYPLLHLCEEPANQHATITITVGLFGAHLDVYRNKVKLGAISYSQEDARRFQAHFHSLADLCAPYMPVERFLRVLQPSA